MHAILSPTYKECILEATAHSFLYFGSYLLLLYGFRLGINRGVVKAIIRAFGAGLMHGMCTLLVGVGISFVRRKSKLFAVGTFGLLSTAIVYRGIYNILIQSEFSIAGALLPIATYIPFFIWRLRVKQKKP